MLISVIICTRNRCDALRDTLTSIDSVRHPPESNVELIVVDNGSTDETPHWLDGASCWSRKVRKVTQPTGGKSTALNSGLAAASGEIIVLTDDDVRPDPQWLINLVKPLTEGRGDAVAGRVVIAPHLIRPWMSPLHMAWLASTDYLDPANPETAVGANMAFKRHVLEKVPGFDPELGPGKLGLWEDTLFSLQLIQAGFALKMANDAIVEHHFDPKRLSREGLLARAYAEAKSSAYVAWHWQHKEKPGRTRRLVRCWIHLFAKRVLRRPEWRRTEGIATWEANLITAIEFERSYSQEKRRIRAYEQFGARKLNQAGSSP